jgi:hypothetical protein
VQPGVHPMLTHPARRSRATVRGALGGFLTALLLALLLVSLPSASQAQVEPAAVLLRGANTPRAKALALHAALLKGRIPVTDGFSAKRCTPLAPD